MLVLRYCESFMIIIIINGLRNRLIVIRELLLLCCTTSLFSVTRKTFNFYNYNAVCDVFYFFLIAVFMFFLNFIFVYAHFWCSRTFHADLHCFEMEAHSLTSSLKCSVCLELYTDPRVLPCLHTFCLKCIKGLRKEDSSLTCP